jgi:AcrR family transcriptional regulator
MPHTRKAPSKETTPNGPQSSSGGLSTTHINEIQRARILAAMAEVAAERGAGDVAVSVVVGRAGVSRRTFYEIFDDYEHCFLSAFDDGVARVSELVLPLYRGPGRWRERVRLALTALLQFFDEEPFLARLLVVESLRAGHRSLGRRSNVFAQLVKAVDESSGDAKANTEAARITAEGVVGAVFSVIHSRLLEGSGSLVELVNPLMSMIVLPYRGSAAARKELERRVPKTATGDLARSRNPLKDLEMRLTYRTLRVLIAVGSHAGASNRVIGEASGISDQGQTSKLLGRLQKIGLVENDGVGAARGEPNAWMLTPRGEEVHDAIALQGREPLLPAQPLGRLAHSQ